jgi:hypothetical protein
MVFSILNTFLESTLSNKPPSAGCDTAHTQSTHTHTHTHTQAPKCTHTHTHTHTSKTGIHNKQAKVRECLQESSSGDARFDSTFQLFALLDAKRKHLCFHERCHEFLSNVHQQRSEDKQLLAATTTTTAAAAAAAAASRHHQKPQQDATNLLITAERFNKGVVLEQTFILRFFVVQTIGLRGKQER